MKKITIALTAILLAGSAYTQTIFEDDFDSYNVNNGIAFQSSDWETWNSPNGGTPDDAKVSANQSFSPNNSVWFNNDKDIIYRFGKKSSGHYQVSFNIYVVANTGAYLNIEHDFGTDYAFDFWFKETNEVWFKNGPDSLQLSTYGFDEWNNVVIDFELDKDSVTIVFNGSQIGQFVYSVSLSGMTPNKVLDVIDFFGITHLAPNDYGITNSNFYIDDFEFTEVWPLGINPLYEEQISVYPNPTSSSMTVDFGTLTNVSLVVRNIMGQVVSTYYPSNESQYSFDINGPSGVYFLEIISDIQESKVIRVLKK